MRILLTSGYNGSRHSLAILELLKREGIAVEQCIVVKTMSVKRIKYYFRQLDFKEFKKKFFDRIASNYSKNVKTSDEIKYVNEFLQEKNIEVTSVSEYCKKNEITCLKVNSLNEKRAIDFVKNVDLAIYTGGGIVGRKFIKEIKIGILNCHGALLPNVRGSNSAEWSILIGVPLANTLHFMVRKLDLGPILKVVHHDYPDCNTIDKLRGLGIVYTIQDVVNMVKSICQGSYTKKEQKLEDGMQYYVMHPILKSFVNAKLDRDQ